MWRRLVARYLGVVEAAGSNPVTQTNTDTVIDTIQSRYLYFIESFAHKKYAPTKIRYFGRCIFLMLADIIIFNN